MNIRFLVLCFFTLFHSSCDVNSKVTNYLNNDLTSDDENFKPGYHKIYKIVDGDTFWVLNEKGQRIKVRLIGVDAPESRNAFNKKKHPFGEFSKEYLKNMLLLDSSVQLVFDVDSLDRFGRTLAYAYLSDGTFINKELVRNGFATILTYPPNVRFERMFFKAQQEAKKKRLGIWGIEMK